MYYIYYTPVNATPHTTKHDSSKTESNTESQDNIKEQSKPTNHNNDKDRDKEPLSPLITNILTESSTKEASTENKINKENEILPHISEEDNEDKENIPIKTQEEILKDANTRLENATSHNNTTHKHNIRNKSGIKPRQFEEIYGSDFLFATALTQMPAKRGIRQFGQRAIDALSAELKQLDTLNILKGGEYGTITAKQMKGPLRTVQLIKEKKDGRIKGCTCMNGSFQRSYSAEEDASSPTVSTKALLLTAAIDAAESRFVATSDITGVFLKAKMDDFVLIASYDTEINAMIQANSKYTKYIKQLNNGKRVIYLQLLKAMYGCLKSARLFWDHLSSS